MVDDVKTKGVKAVPSFKNSKAITRFWGMTSWYHKYIPNYADLAETLYLLKRKRMKLVWASAAQEAYEKLKNALTKVPVLGISKENEQFEIYTDANAVGLRAMLAQDGKTVAVASRTLTAAERKCAVI